MAMALPEQIRPLRRVEYDKLIALGVFQDERIELLDGVLVPMSPIGTRHAFAVDVLNRALVLALHDRAWVRIQNPFAASDISEPEPDVLVAPLAEYRSDHPAEALLLIEVAESSLALDRGRKLRIYSERPVPEYWIVNVAASQIEVYLEPQAGTYRVKRVYERGDRISLQAFPDVSIGVSDVVG